MPGFNLQLIDQHNCIDLKVLQIGVEECHPGHHYGPVVRNNYLFHLITEGKGIFITDKSGTFELKKGQGFLICPDQVATYYADLEDPWTYYWIELDGLRVNQFFNSNRLNIDQPILSFPNDSLERRATHELQFLLDQSNPTTNSLLGHTYLFLDCLEQALPKEDAQKATPSKKQNYFDDVHEFVRYYYAEDITIDQIAEACRLNRSYLNSLFKAEFGISIQQYLIQFRLAKSTQLLTETAMTIKEISKKVGYGNQLHFSKSFKKIYGMSPSSWRKK